MYILTNFGASTLALKKKKQSKDGVDTLKLVQQSAVIICLLPLAVMKHILIFIP